MAREGQGYPCLWHDMMMMMMIPVKQFCSSPVGARSQRDLGTLTGTITPGQSGSGSNGNEVLLHVYQSFKKETSCVCHVQWYVQFGRDGS